MVCPTCKPATLQEWFALRPPVPPVSERQAARLLQWLVKPTPSAHAALMAYSDIMLETGEPETTWSLGFQHGLAVAMQAPEFAQWFYQTYLAETAEDFETTVEHLIDEDREAVEPLIRLFNQGRGAAERGA